MSYQYDAIVIGGGAAGLTTSGICANFGAKTVMIEAEKLGGDCTWHGCVPSKTLLKAAKVAKHIRNASNYGLIDTEPNMDFKKLMEYVRKVRQDIYEEADDPQIYRNMGIEVAEGWGSFVDPHTVKIEGKDGSVREITGRYIFVNTGASTFLPAVEGMDEVNCLTNESLFEIKKAPGEIIIIGSGPIGSEMAQALNLLGCKVTVVDMLDRILANDDEELAEMLQKRLEKEGITYVLGSKILKAERKNDRLQIMYEKDGIENTLQADAMMMATGRRANVKGLNLEVAGVKYDKHGIKVNSRCKTSQSHIYACGDVTGQYQFTHMSEHMAKVAATNAILKFPMTIDKKHVPWVTYTEPELAHVGASEEQLREHGKNYEVYKFPYSKVDRALTDNEAEGMIKVFAKKWNGKILGASVLGAAAGELICEYAVAMKNGVTLRNISDTIHPYPTYGLGARRAADQWYVKNQSEFMTKMIKKLFRYQGELPDLSDPDRIV